MRVNHRQGPDESRGVPQHQIPDLMRDGTKGSGVRREELGMIMGAVSKLVSSVEVGHPTSEQIVKSHYEILRVLRDNLGGISGWDGAADRIHTLLRNDEVSGVLDGYRRFREHEGTSVFETVKTVGTALGDRAREKMREMEDERV
ncbi:MAG: hypothetical protein NTU61_01810, partial [Candidatus Altiarchaeota archaeon]|nr:hypothetical protein [Candidatus Altiarchaeota archaeon]